MARGFSSRKSSRSIEAVVRRCSVEKVLMKNFDEKGKPS